MTRFTIDPQALLHLAEHRLLVHSGHQLVAPNSIRSSCLDLLLARVRTGELTASAALELHDRITEQKIRMLGDRVSRRTAFKIACENDWTTIADAEYLAITQLQADALVALDPDLTAKGSGIVPLADIGVLLTK